MFSHERFLCIWWHQYKTAVLKCTIPKIRYERKRRTPPPPFPVVICKIPRQRAREAGVTVISILSISANVLKSSVTRRLQWRHPQSRASRNVGPPQGLADSFRTLQSQATKRVASITQNEFTRSPPASHFLFFAVLLSLAGLPPGGTLAPSCVPLGLCLCLQSCLYFHGTTGFVHK